ncbi:MAG: hypothetical protein RR635_11315, partial [Oscillospiraceae bacterium]
MKISRYKRQMVCALSVFSLVMNIIFYNFYIRFCGEHVIQAIDDAKSIGIGMTFYFLIIVTAI